MPIRIPNDPVDDSLTPKFLLVEDDVEVAKSVRRIIRSHADVTIAHSVEQGLAALRMATKLSGLIVDVRLPDGSGFSVLRAAQAQQPRIPALVMSALYDHATVAEAQLLGAQYLRKPPGDQNLIAFVGWATARHPEPAVRIQLLVGDLAREARLSQRETELVRWTAGGVAVSALPDRMGVSINTVKTLVRRVLRKCNAMSMEDLVKPLRRSALDHWVDDSPGRAND